MRIQPIDFASPEVPCEPIKPAAKSRFKRLFERQFPGLLRTLSAEKPDQSGNKDFSDEFEPSSVCLAKMVQNFIEEGEEKNRCCYCFNRNCTDSEEDVIDSCNCFGETSNNSSVDAYELLKQCLVPCVILAERNLLADTSKIIEKNKMNKRKDNVCRKTIVDNLIALGYDASICQSRWEKSPRIPAGDYEYIDVVFEGDRLIIDVEFRSEFEIARSTKAYKSVLQALPNIFVGKSDRLQKIICVVSEAAKHSLKKKGMAVPPWRQSEYVKAKWLSPYTRFVATSENAESSLKLKEEGIFEADKKMKLFKPQPPDCNCNSIDSSDGVFLMSKCVGEQPVPKANVGVKKMTGLSSLIEFEEKP